MAEISNVTDTVNNIVWHDTKINGRGIYDHQFFAVIRNLYVKII